MNGSSWGTGILLFPGMVLTCSHILSRHPTTRNGTSLVTVLDSVSVTYISGRHVYTLYVAILKEAIEINSLKFTLMRGGGGGGGCSIIAYMYMHHVINHFLHEHEVHVYKAHTLQ